MSDRLRFFVPAGKALARPPAPRGFQTRQSAVEAMSPWTPGTILSLDDFAPGMARKDQVSRASNLVAQHALYILPEGLCAPIDMQRLTAAGVSETVLMDRGIIADTRRLADKQMDKLSQMMQSDDSERVVRREQKYTSSDLDGYSEGDLLTLYKREFPDRAAKDPDGVNALNAQELRAGLGQIGRTTGTESGNEIKLDGENFREV